MKAMIGDNHKHLPGANFEGSIDYIKIWKTTDLDRYAPPIPCILCTSLNPKNAIQCRVCTVVFDNIDGEGNN